MSYNYNQQFRIRKPFPWGLTIAGALLGIAGGLIVQRDVIKEKLAPYYPIENVAVNIEPLLNGTDYTPEEFYIKLFQNDGFIPIGLEERCKPTKCKDPAWTNLDGKYHDTDLYAFALQGVSSGHRPINRRTKVSDSYDDSTTWLNAVQEITNLHVEDPKDQETIKAWIAANYTRIFHDGRTIEKENIHFKMENGVVVDILYDGSHKAEKYTVQEFHSGFYKKQNKEWIPEGQRKEQHKVADKKGHLTLPAPSDEKQMLVVPDYILRDNINTIDAAVYTGRGRYSRYIISIEEIVAELEQVRKNRKTSIPVKDTYAQMILTPTLELVVSDITKDKKNGQQGWEAILDLIEKEPYANTDDNTSPLVTLIAGGKCGATSGELAAMLYLGGLQEFSFVHFPDINHIGVYGPLKPGLSLLPKFGEYDQYWFVETTNGTQALIGEVMPKYGKTVFDAKVPKPFDLRPQLQHLKSAQEMKRRNKK